MGGGCNAGLQTGLNQPQKSPRGSARHHTCTSRGQEGNDSPTAWLRALTISASLNWQFCLPVQGEENLCCRRISDPLSPPSKNNRLNGDQVRIQGRDQRQTVSNGETRRCCPAAIPLVGSHGKKTGTDLCRESRSQMAFSSPDPSWPSGITQN